MCVFVLLFFFNNPATFEITTSVQPRSLPDPLPIVFARLGGVDFAPAEALLLALPVLALTAMLLVAERWTAGGRSFATLGRRSCRKAPMALCPWRAPASLFCWLVAALSAAPVAALAWRAGWDGFAELPLWIGNGVSNSLLPAALAATVIAIVAIPVGHGLARRDRVTAGLDIVAFAAFVAPPALLGVDRKSGVSGKRVSVRVELGVSRIIKKKQNRL